MALFAGSARIVPVIDTHIANNQIKSNVIPNTTTQIITPDFGYTGFAQVTVDAIPTAYVIPSGTYNVSSAGTFNISTYLSASVPSMTNNLTLTTPTIDSSNAKINYGITVYSGFKSISQSFSSAYTLPTVSGSTIIPSDTSIIIVPSYKWTTGSIYIDTTSTWDVFKDWCYDRLTDSQIYYLMNSVISSSYIASYLFGNQRSIVNVVGPSHIQKISDNAFIYASMTTISFPNVTTILYSAFNWCENLTTVNFPKASMVYTSAFYACQNLVNVNMPELTSINGTAFLWCTKISNLSFPKLSVIAGISAFGHCHNLQSVYFPLLSSITGSYTFAYCSSLSTVSFPKLSILGSMAFYSCSNLSSIYLMNSVVCSLAASDAFHGTIISTANGKIYVPTSLVTSYKTADQWSYFSTKIVGI